MNDEPQTLTPEQEQQLVNEAIVQRLTTAFFVAGAEVLRQDFRFTEREAAEWAILTDKRAAKYARLNGQGETATDPRE